MTGEKDCFNLQQPHCRPVDEEKQSSEIIALNRLILNLILKKILSGTTRAIKGAKRQYKYLHHHIQQKGERHGIH